MSHQSREADLAAAFVDLADGPLGDGYDVIAFLHTLTEHCVRLLEVASAAVLLAPPPGGVLEVAASDETSRALQSSRVTADEGPGHDCHRTGRAIPDVPLRHPHARAIWPRFGRAARVLGYTSVAAVPLRPRKEVIGALVLLNTQPTPVDADRVRLAQALADTAAISILQQRTLHDSTRLAAQLQTALSSRVIIEQAKGVLAERRGLNVQDAFEQMRAYARYHRRRLTDVAQEVIDSVSSTPVALDQAPRPGRP